MKNQVELLKLAKEEGIELNDEQLEALSGGCNTGSSPLRCPQCGSEDLTFVPMTGFHAHKYNCNSSGNAFTKADAQVAVPK